MPDRIDLSFRRLILFLFEDIFSILFYIIFPNFKVLDIILEIVGYTFIVNRKDPIVLEKVFHIKFYFLFHFFLGGREYVVPFGTAVTGILDMRFGKHDLHFLVGVELLPHAFVNIPDERVHIGVFIFIVYFIYVFFCVLIFIHIYLLTVFYKWEYNCNSY
jgi:hypothetical protein